MPDSIRETTYFQTGVESVTVGAPPEAATLPEARAVLAPSDEGMDNLLEDLLRAPALDGRLLHALRPTLTSRDVLAPGAYGALLESARAVLRALVDDAGPDEKDNTFSDAADLLEEEKGLRELLAMYRHVLHKA